MLSASEGSSGLSGIYGRRRVFLFYFYSPLRLYHSHSATILLLTVEVVYERVHLHASLLKKK